MIKVVLVDDEELVRTGLRLILQSADDITVVGEAGGQREALAAISEHRPDVVLLDVRMPDVDGLATLEDILSRKNPPYVAMLTTFDLDEYVHRALRIGASGFLLKDSSRQELVDSVRAVVEGQAMLSPAVTKKLIDAYVGREPDRAEHARQHLQTLTDRESDIAYAVADGLSNDEVSKKLHMSEATVKTHLSRAMSKLNLTNRVQLALLAHDARTGR